MANDTGIESGTTPEQMSNDEFCRWLAQQRRIYTSPIIRYDQAPSQLKEQNDLFNDMIGKVGDRLAKFEKPYQRTDFMSSVKRALVDGDHLTALDDSQYLHFLEQVLLHSHNSRDQK